MNRELIDPVDAVESGKKLKWGLIYKNDGIVAGSLNKIKDSIPPLVKMNEARFFNEEEEIHIFRCNGDFNAVRTSGNRDEAIEFSYETDGDLKSITVRKYIDYDGDGQAFVAKTCLSGMEV